MTNVVHLDTRRRTPCSCPAHRLDALLARTTAQVEAEGSLLVPRSVIEAIVSDIRSTIVSVNAPTCPDIHHQRGGGQ